MKQRHAMILLIAALLASPGVASSELKYASAQQPDERKGPAPLLIEFEQALERSKQLDSLENIQVVSASVFYLSAILHNWNPAYEREQIAIALLKDLHRTRSVNSLIRVAAAALDATYPIHASHTASLLNPVISALNPEAGALLNQRLGLPTAFDDLLQASGTSSVRIMDVMMKDALTHRRAKPVLSPPSVGARSRGTLPRPALKADFLGELLTGEGSPYYTGTDNLGAPRPAAQRSADGRAPFSGVTLDEVGACVSCLAKLYAREASIFKAGVETFKITGRPEAVLVGAVASYVLTAKDRRECGTACGYPPATTVRTSAWEKPIAYLQNGFNDEEKVAQKRAAAEAKRKVDAERDAAVAAAQAEEARRKGDAKKVEQAEQARKDAEARAAAAEKTRVESERDVQMYRRIKDQLTSSSRTSIARTDPTFDGPLPPTIGPHVRYNFVIVEHLAERAVLREPELRIPSQPEPVTGTILDAELTKLRKAYGVPN